jgi:LysM domain
VEPGQTLWDLADRYAPDGTDLRAYVDAVVGLNDLGTRAPVAGERIKLPK